MLQAEIAGRLFPSLERYPAKGRVVRDFQLLSSERQPVLLSEIRGHRNMVLVFVGKTAKGKALPGVAEILSWLEFTNRQCPECGPVEWPD